MQIALDTASRADAAAHIDEAVWHAFHDAGMAMAPFAESLGGGGFGEPQHQVALCTLLRLLGGADLSIARLFEGHANAVMLVARYGAPDQIRALANNTASGALSGVWAAEDATGLRLEQLDNGGILRGRKIFASGAGLLRCPLVTATVPAGKVMCLLDLDGSEAIDLSAWHPLGMRATATGSVDFSGMTVSRGQLIGAPDDFTRQPFFSAGAWRFCAAHVGAMERLVELFRDHLLTRGRGQDPYQLERLAHCTAAARTALFWVEESARRFGDDQANAEETVAFVNMTRMVTERAALDVMEAVQRGIGLTGFLNPHPVERICRDLATYSRQPVPDLAMSDAARAVLNGDLRIGEPV